jgi:hypothetical protein
MIQAVEAFFERMMDSVEMDQARIHSDQTYEHIFTIHKINIVNMMVDRIIKARNASPMVGTKKVSKTAISNIIKTKIWNKHYTQVNVRTKLREAFGSTGKSTGIFVAGGTGGGVKVTLMAGKYAELHVNNAGQLTKQPKLNHAMMNIWLDAMSDLKTYIGKESGYSDMFGGAPESWNSPAHPGQRDHGTVSAGGSIFQTTVATQVLAEGGGEGVGYDDAVVNFLREFERDFPINENEGVRDFTDQVIKKVFNPIKKTYRIKDVQDFTEASGVKKISVQIEYGDAAYNARMGWADAGGIKKAAKENMDATIRWMGFNQKELEDIPWIKGSDSFAAKSQKIVKAKLIQELLKIKGTRPDFRLKVNKKLLKEARQAKKKVKNKGSIKGKAAGAALVSSRKAKKQKVRGGRAAANKGVGKTAQSPIALRNLLNEALPQTVAKNMGSPALNFRTGRFANSARVEMVHQGARGGTAIDYTYMKNPYQTFEPGFKQGSTMRDPRKIIGESIRELATGILGRAPHTVRRT